MLKEERENELRRRKITEQFHVNHILPFGSPGTCRISMTVQSWSSGVCRSQMKNATGDCQGRTHSQQQEHFKEHPGDGWCLGRGATSPLWIFQTYACSILTWAHLHFSGILPRGWQGNFRKISAAKLADICVSPLEMSGLLCSLRHFSSLVYKTYENCCKIAPSQNPGAQSDVINVLLSVINSSENWRKPISSHKMEEEKKPAP